MNGQSPKPATGAKAVSMERRAEEFMELLRAQGYAKATLYIYRRALARFIEAMASKGLGAADLSPRRVKAATAIALEGTGITHQRYSAVCIDRFVGYLIETGDVPAPPKPRADTSPRACLRREYETYLRDQRGLVEGTIICCLRFYDRFLTFKFGDKLGNLDRIRPSDISAFMLRQREEERPYQYQSAPSYLRRLFQFLFWSGRTKSDLSKAVLRARPPQPPKIPRYLPPEDVNRLVNAAVLSKRTGRRDHAMLLLMARLGLRAPEVLAIRLDDIDWRRGEILIRGKNKFHDRMPLPADAGAALVGYIKDERRGESRMLFVSSQAPFAPLMNPDIVNSILKRAYDETGIRPPHAYIGSHILRHSLATDLLRNGASLEEVGDVLRHRSLMTTTIYARHDIDELRSLARPWPVKGGAA